VLSELAAIGVSLRLRKWGGVSKGGETYGGRKNCSSTTYIPRTISDSRKYLPALSRAVSLLSSQRLTRGRRKPEGGGPAGVAARGADEENEAVMGRGQGVRAERRVVRAVVVGRVLRESIMRVRGVAMVVDGEVAAMDVEGLQVDRGEWLHALV